MACLVIGYALLNVVVYFVSGSFGPGWFVASLLVYGAALVAALLLLAADRHEREDGPVATVQVMNVQAADPHKAASAVATVTGEAMVVAPPSDIVVVDDKR